MNLGVRNSLIIFGLLTFACAVFAQDITLPKIEGTNTYKVSDFTFNQPATNYLNTNNDTMNKYSKSVAENLRKNWDKEKIFANTNERAIVLLTIQKDGTITNTKIIYHSKDENLNNSVNNYIKTITKVESLPDIYKNNSYTMLVNFGKKSNIDEIDFSKYMQNLQKTIKNNWTVNRVQKEVSRNVVALIGIKKDGSLAYPPKIITSSGDEQYDDSCLKAIQTIEKFDPLPKEYNGEQIDIQFTFDMKVWRDKIDWRDNSHNQKPQTTSDFVETNYQSFADNYKIMNKNLFLHRDDFVYLKLIKNDDDNNYKTYKIDCSNGQLGYIYTYNPYSRIAYSDIKLSAPRKNSFDEKVFDYACQQ